MDVGWFLRERVKFIRQLYANAAAPFVERQRQIEAEEQPFEPVYDESGEPRFELEWNEADRSRHVPPGYACVSMLSDSLKVFFATWERLIGVARDPATDSVRKKRGFVAGYAAFFEARLHVRLADSGVDLELLEEIVLVRNRVQHAESLTTMLPSHAEKDLDRLKNPYFLDASEHEILARSDGDGESAWLMAPTIKVTAGRLNGVLDAVDRLADLGGRRARTVPLRAWPALRAGGAGDHLSGGNP
ncbi:hypothetical protein WJ542_13945 [Paraburkholderia sp. B3]|uniref:hypothetical protein n=1 Tax=Paraburkholderia sp. B3 TaxID=3134791 RepID=UPI003981C29C